MKSIKKTKKVMEQIHESAYKTIKFLLETNVSISERKIAEDYDFDRGLVGTMACKIIIEKALQKFDDKKNLEIIQAKPITIFRPLIQLKDESQLVIYEFFLSFGNVIYEAKTSEVEKLKEILDLYLNKKIKTPTDYFKIKEKEAKDYRKKYRHAKVLIDKLTEENERLNKIIEELEASKKSIVAQKTLDI